MAENEQFSHLCPLLTSGSAQRFRKADLETHETQGSRGERDIPRRGPINRRTDRQMNPKRTRQRLGGGGVRETLRAGVRQAEMGD